VLEPATSSFCFPLSHVRLLHFLSAGATLWLRMRTVLRASWKLGRITESVQLLEERPRNIGGLTKTLFRHTGVSIDNFVHHHNRLVLSSSSQQPTRQLHTPELYTVANGPPCSRDPNGRSSSTASARRAYYLSDCLQGVERVLGEMKTDHREIHMCHPHPRFCF